MKKIMKEGSVQLAQALLFELIEFVTMEKSTNVQHEAILDFIIDFMGNNIFLKKLFVIFVCIYMIDMTIPMIIDFHKIVYHTFLVIYVSCPKP